MHQSQLESSFSLVVPWPDVIGYRPLTLFLRSAIIKSISVDHQYVQKYKLHISAFWVNAVDRASFNILNPEHLFKTFWQ